MCADIYVYMDACIHMCMCIYMNMYIHIPCANFMYCFLQASSTPPSHSHFSRALPEYVYIYICMYMNIYIYMCMRVSVYTYVYINTKYIYSCEIIPTYMYIYICICISQSHPVSAMHSVRRILVFIWFLMNTMIYSIPQRAAQLQNYNKSIAHVVSLGFHRSVSSVADFWFVASFSHKFARRGDSRAK